jgi:hypothetical protein
LAPAEVGAWTAARHAQIERGELVWISHNLDVLARAPRGDTAPLAIASRANADG